MKENIKEIFNKDIKLKEKENQEKQKLINELLYEIKKEETKNEYTKDVRFNN